MEYIKPIRQLSDEPCKFFVFTDFGLVMPHDDVHLGHHWLEGSDLLPDGTKQSPEPILI